MNRPQVAPGLFTRSDYFNAPEDGLRYQLIEGDLIPNPTPPTVHQTILANLVVTLAAAVRGNRLGKVYFGVAVVLTKVNAFEPDLIFVSNERKSIITKRGIDGAPDFIVEILSPSTARYDKGIKRSLYARTGVVELWLIDPALRQIRVYHLREDPENPIAVYSSLDTFESPIFPGLRFYGAEIFEE
jgi:Uma2 family endonuclease